MSGCACLDPWSFWNASWCLPDAEWILVTQISAVSWWQTTTASSHLWFKIFKHGCRVQRWNTESKVWQRGIVIWVLFFVSIMMSAFVHKSVCRWHYLDEREPLSNVGICSSRDPHWYPRIPHSPHRVMKTPSGNPHPSSWAREYLVECIGIYMVCLGLNIKCFVETHYWHDLRTNLPHSIRQTHLCIMNRLASPFA